MKLVEQLTKITKETREKLTREAEARKAKANEAAIRQAKKDEADAKAFLSDVEEKCLAAAKSGQNSCVLAKKLEKKWFDENSYDNPYAPSNFGKIVLDGLKEMELNAKYAYAHDGVGIKSWYNLEVWWPA